MLALTAIDRGSVTIAKRGGGIRHPWHVPRESLHVQYFVGWAPNFKLNMTGEYSELTTEEYSTEGRKCLVYKENNLYVSKNCEHKQSMGENLHGSIQPTLVYKANQSLLHPVGCNRSRARSV